MLTAPLVPDAGGNERQRSVIKLDGLSGWIQHTDVLDGNLRDVVHLRDGVKLA